MILIKTKRGNVLINDSNITEVRHLRDVKQVIVFFKGSSVTYFDVESITYANNAQPTEWKEEGSELEYLKEREKHLLMRLSCESKLVEETENRLRELGAWCEDVPTNFFDQIPKELSKQLSKKGIDAKSYVNNHEGWHYRVKFEEEHKDEEIEASEVERLNAVIDKLTRRIETSKELDIRHREAIERIMSRNLFERIINKKTYL